MLYTHLHTFVDQLKKNFFCTLPPEVEMFFMFSKTSLNTNLWKVHRFFGFSKKLLENLYPFLFYVVLNIAFLKETKVHMENSFIFGHFFEKTNFYYFKKYILYNITTSSAIPHFKDKSS